MSAPDDIPPGPVGRASLIEALSKARAVPVEALDEAARAPGKIAQEVLDLAGRAASGEELSDEEANLLFWGIHVLAEAGDTRLFGPLLGLGRLPSDDLHFLIGDAVTETFSRLLISTYDGGWDAFAAAIRDPGTEDFARWSEFGAAAYLTATGRVDREAMHALLESFAAERLVDGSDQGWNGWAEALCLLGFADLRPLLEDALKDGRLLETVNEAEWYFEQLAATANGPDLRAFDEEGLRPFSNAVDELHWAAPAGEFDDDELAGAAPAYPGGTFRNPWRDVGRNDPCPCGSGKKFKKCCLEAGNG